MWPPIKTGVFGFAPIQRRLVNQQGNCHGHSRCPPAHQRIRRREGRDDTRDARQARGGVDVGSVRRLAGDLGSILVAGQFDSIHTVGRSSPVLSCWQRCSAARGAGEPRIGCYL
jgi:hypothetical protein